MERSRISRGLAVRTRTPVADVDAVAREVHHPRRRDALHAKGRSTMRRSHFYVVAVLAAALWMTGQARASSFVASLDGSQEVPPTPSTGTGTATVDLDLSLDTITVNLSFSNLLAPETNATIDGPAPPGVEAPMSLYTLDVQVPGDFSGTVDNQVITLTDLGSYTVAQQISDLESGLWYINVQSTLFFEGEIRGQIVPEPSSLVLSSVALVGLFACRSRLQRMRTRLS
jgi:hypothetical protein